MSLNKTLDRLFDEIRREAKRNPEFADRLDAVLRLHESRREVSEETLQQIAVEAPAQSKPKKSAPSASTIRVPAPPATAPAPPLNPAGVYKRDGEDALVTALGGLDLGSLRALVAEHNLDPGGLTGALTRDELATHVVAQAKKRAERDEKMFDY
jgi:hypothetical protein